MQIVLDQGLASLIDAPCEFTAAVSTVAEAVACLRANFDRFTAVLPSLCFRVTVGYDDAGEGDLHKPIARKVQIMRFSIVPSGSGQVGKIILGVALIGLAFMGGLPFLGMSGLTTGLLGGALLIGALFGQQKDPAGQEKDGRKSNVFSRPQQTLVEGGRMPVVYGLHLSGWTIVSARATNYLI
jgi:predicted phage tail protein